jgi:hypothetical protein
VLQLYSCTECARSRGYKLVGRGSSFPSPGWWCLVVYRSNPCDHCPPLLFIVSRGEAQGEIQKSYSAWQLVRPVVRRCQSGGYRSRVMMPCRGSRCVVRLDCSLRDAWPSPRVVWACLSLPECLPSLPRPARARRRGCLLSLACGRVGDDGDVMAARLVRPALRLLPGRATCMAASCCFRMTWRFAPPRASVAPPE